MKRFEYKIFTKIFHAEERLNELGEQGWELVAAWGGDFYMKREIQ